MTFSENRISADCPGSAASSISLSFADEKTAACGGSFLPGSLTPAGTDI